MTLATIPTQKLVLLLLAAYGFAWILGSSHITLGIRTWMERAGMDFTLTLMECPGCLGWWTGGGLGLFLGLTGAAVVILGLAVTASNLVLHALVSTMDGEE